MLYLQDRVGDLHSSPRASMFSAAQQFVFLTHTCTSLCKHSLSLSLSFTYTEAISCFTESASQLWRTCTKDWTVYSLWWLCSVFHYYLRYNLRCFGGFIVGQFRSTESKRERIFSSVPSPHVALWYRLCLCVYICANAMSVCVYGHTFTCVHIYLLSSLCPNDSFVCCSYRT